MKRPRQSLPSGAEAVLLALLFSAPVFGAASEPVAPERRAAWEKERHRAQAVAELLVRQEGVRRQGNTGSTMARSGAAAEVVPQPLGSTPGADAGLSDLFMDDEQGLEDSPESTPLLPATIPGPVHVPPVALPSPPIPLPVAPLLNPPTPAGQGGVELFHLGYSRFSQGDWAGARDAFESFIAAHPSHDLTDNAAFWLAECAAQEGPAAAALEQFQEMARQFPNSDKAPDTQVRIAVLEGQAGRPAEARRVLEGVVRDWPGTAAARRASELLAAAPPAAR